MSLRGVCFVLVTSGIALRTSLRIFSFVWTLNSYFMRRTLLSGRYIPPGLTRITELRKHLYPPSYSDLVSPTPTFVHSARSICMCFGFCSKEKYGFVLKTPLNL